MKAFLVAVAIPIIVNHVWCIQKERRSSANAAMERDRLVRDAKLAETEGRYEDMAATMTTLVQTGVELSSEEKQLFLVAHRNVNRKQSLARATQKIDHNTSPDFETRDNAKTLVAYEEAFDAIRKTTPPGNPLTLNVAILFSTFVYETLESHQKACNIASEAYDDALGDVNVSSNNDKWDEESEFTLKLLRSKMKSWGCKDDDGGDVEKLKENVLRRLEKKLRKQLPQENKAQISRMMDEFIKFNVFEKHQSYSELTQDEKHERLELILHTLVNQFHHLYVISNDTATSTSTNTHQVLLK